MRPAGGLVAVVAILVGCTDSRSPPTLAGSNPSLSIEMPASPEPETRPGPVDRAVSRIARDIERRYDLVEVWGANAHDRGRVVVYAVRFRLDERSEHPDFDDWNTHVGVAAADQREAAVSMLRRTVMVLPRVRLVSVYQDRILQPFWSRQQIEEMARPARYRGFADWRRLVLSAEVLPGRPAG